MYEQYIIDFYATHLRVGVHKYSICANNYFNAHTIDFFITFVTYIIDYFITSGKTAKFPIFNMIIDFYICFPQRWSSKIFNSL